MNNLYLGDFDSSQDANFDFWFFHLYVSLTVFSETRDLRVVLALSKVIQQSVVRIPCLLVRSFGPSLARTLTKSVQFVSGNNKINNFFVNMHLR